MALDPLARPLTFCDAFLKEAVIRASAMGMTADDLTVGILSLAGVHPAVAKADTEVLLVECSQQEFDFFARELQAHLPVRVDKVRLRDLATVVRRRKLARRWGEPRSRASSTSRR